MAMPFHTCYLGQIDMFTTMADSCRDDVHAHRMQADPTTADVPIWSPGKKAGLREHLETTRIARQASSIQGGGLI